jgi:hypothetical protein
MHLPLCASLVRAALHPILNAQPWHPLKLAHGVGGQGDVKCPYPDGVSQPVHVLLSNSYIKTNKHKGYKTKWHKNDLIWCGAPN